jgi:hypothetical protein
MAKECRVRQCTCAACQADNQREKEDHRYLNLILSRLDEQQRRWVAGREARRRGHGGIQQVAEITGLHPETIRIGRDELNQDLVGRPTDRVRLPGGGRPCVEKKIPLS